MVASLNAIPRTIDMFTFRVPIQGGKKAAGHGRQKVSRGGRKRGTKVEGNRAGLESKKGRQQDGRADGRSKDVRGLDSDKETPSDPSILSSLQVKDL